MGMMGRGGMGRMGMMGRMRGRRRGMGMMGGMGRCPMCGQMMGEEQEEGEHRGKGPARHNDEQIKAQVEEALTEDSWLDASNVQVEVQNGIVTLAGTVDSRESKRRAKDLADEVPGVRDVRNNLSIEGL
jgi:osmotically-inducible protein OsmY